jgi:hypothetical protein
VTLLGKGYDQSRVDLKLSGGLRTEIHNNSSGFPGTRTGTNGVIATALPLHDCFTDPRSGSSGPLSSLAAASSPNFVFFYVGLEQRNGVSVQHLRAYQVFGGKPRELALVQRLSASDFYLDAASFLPLVITFQVHPDDDMNANIPAEVRFANYQSVKPSSYSPAGADCMP